MWAAEGGRRPLRHPLVTMGAARVLPPMRTALVSRPTTNLCGISFLWGGRVFGLMRLRGDHEGCSAQRWPTQCRQTQHGNREPTRVGPPHQFLGDALTDHKRVLHVKAGRQKVERLAFAGAGKAQALLRAQHVRGLEVVVREVPVRATPTMDHVVHLLRKGLELALPEPKEILCQVSIDNLKLRWKSGYSADLSPFGPTRSLLPVLHGSSVPKNPWGGFRESNRPQPNHQICNRSHSML